MGRVLSALSTLFPFLPPPEEQRYKHGAEQMQEENGTTAWLPRETTNNSLGVNSADSPAVQFQGPRPPREKPVLFLKSLEVGRSANSKGVESIWG